MMPINGEELYAIYADENLTVGGAEVEEWESMPEEEKAVWDAFAANLLERASD